MGFRILIHDALQNRRQYLNLLCDRYWQSVIFYIWMDFYYIQNIKHNGIVKNIKKCNGIMPTIKIKLGFR